METHFEIYKCRDCENGTCRTYKCNNCIDQENLFSFDVKKYDEPYPPISCSGCYDDKAPICSNCAFICKGCYDFCCKKYHFTEICPTCDAEFCDKEEWEFSKCIGCNRTNCSFCKYVLCSYFKTWIDCSEYNACKFCYSSTIMQYYKDPIQYMSCMKIINLLKNKSNLCMPIYIIQIIAMFLNNCDVSQ